MELGALVCTPQNPACAACPVSSFCGAYKEGDPESYPVRSPRRKTVKVEAAALALRKGGKFLLRLRPLGGIMGGLWEFPEWKLARDKIKIEHAGRIKRNYTHHLETLDVFTAMVSEKTEPRTKWKHVWASPKEFAHYPFSSAHAKIANLLR
jgi:A/G-specific adenine glycosylase